MSFRFVTAAQSAIVLSGVLCGTAAWAQTAGKTEILWLGQASTRITTPGGKVIVIGGFVASALARHNVEGALVAPAAR